MRAIQLQNKMGVQQQKREEGRDVGGEATQPATEKVCEESGI